MGAIASSCRSAPVARSCCSSAPHVTARAARLPRTRGASALGRGASRPRAFGAKVRRAAAITAVSRLMPGADLSLAGAARHLRFPSLEEPGAAFTDAPASLDKDPAGGALAPPIDVYSEIETRPPRRPSTQPLGRGPRKGSRSRRSVGPRSHLALLSFAWAALCGARACARLVRRGHHGDDTARRRALRHHGTEGRSRARRA